MEIFEITSFQAESLGFHTGINRSGVNYLQPTDSWQNMVDGFLYRQVVQSRRGITKFADRLAGETRVFGIYEHTLPDATKKLLVFDKNFVYKYDTNTGQFNQLAFGGSLAAYTGFDISAPEFYISGASYGFSQFTAAATPNTAYTTPGGRFVFCGKGINPTGTASTIFFYDDTNNDIRCYTDIADNPAYKAPPQGSLDSAQFVYQFNNRLNFVNPIINGVQYSQAVLFSALTNISGNGDRFNIASSGITELDTSENIVGASILGNVFVMNCDRSNWIIEKTQDAFSPYFTRKVPGVIGTDAPFSPVAWNEFVKSVGRTGVVGTDNRQSLRVDNKIPNFTADEIDQVKFAFTYGGFDRTNNQFLFSYVDGASNAETQNKILVENYEFDTWAMYNLRLTCFGQTDLGLNLNWNEIDETAGDDSWSQWNTTEELWNRIGLGASVQKTLAGDDLGYIYELNADNDDYLSAISAITVGATTVITIDDNAFETGDLVVVQNVSGVELDGRSINNYDPDTDPSSFVPYLVLSSTGADVEIEYNSTGYSAWSSGGTLSKVISFTGEMIPFNPYRSEGRKVYIGYIEFYINTNGGFLYLDAYADENTTPFMENILAKPTAVNQPYEWVGISVDQEANFITFKIRMQSPATQMKITNVRIHASRGGMTGN